MSDLHIEDVYRDLKLIEKSLKTLNNCLCNSDRSEEIKNILKMGEEFIISPTADGMILYKKMAISLIQDILASNSDNIKIKYFLKVLKDDPTRLDEIITLIQKDNLEILFDENRIEDLLVLLPDTKQIKQEPLLSFFKKANKKTIFKYWYNKCFNDLEKTDKSLVDLLDLVNEDNNLIDKDLLTDKIINHFESDDIQNMIKELHQLPGGEAYVKKLIMDGVIKLHFIFAFNFFAINLLTQDERLERFKKYTYLNNSLCGILFHHEKGFLSFVGKQDEILTKEQIRELFNNITGGKDPKEIPYLSNINDSVLKELGISKPEKP